MDHNDGPTPSDLPPNGLTRRGFALTSGAAILGGLLAAPRRLLGATEKQHPAQGGGARRSSSDEFDLRITILGLCLFVRDFADRRMHVLMPSTGEHAHGSGGRVDQHLARLVYDSAYERPGASQLQNRPVFVPLENGALDLTSLASRGEIDLTFPYEVVDLDPIVQERVNKNRLSSDTAGRVISRVSVGAGSITALDAGVRWSFGDSPPRHMAIAVDWTIPGVTADSLRSAILGMNGGSDRVFPALHPIDGSIQMYVYHTPPEELPPYADRGELPAPGELAEHFSAYYGLYDNPKARPLPAYREVPGSYSAGHGRAIPARYTRHRGVRAAAPIDGSSVHLSGGSHNLEGGTNAGDFTIMGLSPPCMSATATLEP
jgi:hypothetical protein